jgi:uncharacterized surface protein with fasciclin (FAS1) repeats
MTLDELKADTELLTSILTHHVVSGVVISSDLSDGMEVETLNGDVATVGETDDGFTIHMVPIADPDYLGESSGK